MSHFERLDSEAIKAAIEPENLHHLAQLTLFDTIDSTNSYLLSQAKTGASGGSVCFAEQQTQGRGRRGRTWFSPGGANIYCSLLWRFQKEETITGLSIAIGVMVTNVLRKYGISHGIQLKWPNDILFAGRKLGGILLERNDQSGVVIGIGLNVYLPEEAEPQWIAIQEIIGRQAMRNYLAGLLVNELLAQLPLYQMRGLDPFLSQWRKHDMLLDQAVTIHMPTKTVTGRVCGINEQGELLLQDESGNPQCFCYGEVSVRGV